MNFSWYFICYILVKDVQGRCVNAIWSHLSRDNVQYSWIIKYFHVNYRIRVTVEIRLVQPRLIIGNYLQWLRYSITLCRLDSADCDVLKLKLCVTVTMRLPSAVYSLMLLSTTVEPRPMLFSYTVCAALRWWWNEWMGFSCTGGPFTGSSSTWKRKHVFYLVDNTGPVTNTTRIYKICWL